MNQKSSDNDSSALVNVSNLAEALRMFAVERNWDQFHSPKNLIMALTGEVGELTEIFQWLTDAQSREACNDPTTAKKIEHELADVLLYLVRLSDVLGVDLNQAAANKLKLNAAKYPADRAYGSSKKYDEL